MDHYDECACETPDCDGACSPDCLCECPEWDALLLQQGRMVVVGADRSAVDHVLAHVWQN